MPVSRNDGGDRDGELGDFVKPTSSQIELRIGHTSIAPAWQNLLGDETDSLDY
jgi:hypothetical protein